MPVPQFGAAEEFIENLYGGPTDEIESYVSTSAAVVKVKNNEPDALSLLIANLGSNDVYLGLSDDVSATKGFYLAKNGGTASMNVRDDMTLPSRAWFGVSPAGASTLYTLVIKRYAPS